MTNSMRQRFVHRPEDGVKQQSAERGNLEVVGMTQRRKENARLAVHVGPGDRLGLFVGDRADQ